LNSASSAPIDPKYCRSWCPAHNRWEVIGDHVEIGVALPLAHLRAVHAVQAGVDADGAQVLDVGVDDPVEQRPGVQELHLQRLPGRVAQHPVVAGVHPASSSSAVARRAWRRSKRAVGVRRRRGEGHVGEDFLGQAVAERLQHGQFLGRGMPSASRCVFSQKLSIGE
jgi:hypothetical protein